MAKIIQWNCRGLRANFEELELLIKNYEPVGICLLELQVSDSYILDNNLYILLSKLSHIPTGHRPHGGASILIRKDLPYIHYTS
jgi:exonuclease III